MRNKLLVLLVIISMFAIVAGLDSPDAGVDSGDYEAIQSLTEKIPIDPDTGEFDPSMIFGKSEAEIRIDAMNMWLEENATWLKAVFGMVPSITMLFFFVFWWWLFFFVNLVLNGNLWNLAVSDRKIDMFLFEIRWGSILGTIVFLIMLAFKIPRNLGIFFHGILSIVYNYGWIGILVTIVGFILIAIFFPQFTKKILDSSKERAEEKAREATSVERKVIHKTVKGITGE